MRGPHIFCGGARAGWLLVSPIRLAVCIFSNLSRVLDCHAHFRWPCQGVAMESRFSLSDVTPELKSQSCFFIQAVVTAKDSYAKEKTDVRPSTPPRHCHRPPSRPSLVELSHSKIQLAASGDFSFTNVVCRGANIPSRMSVGEGEPDLFQPSSYMILAHAHTTLHANGWVERNSAARPTSTT